MIDRPTICIIIKYKIYLSSTKEYSRTSILPYMFIGGMPHKLHAAIQLINVIKVIQANKTKFYILNKAAAFYACIHDTNRKHKSG